MLAIYDKAYPAAAPQEAPGVGVFGAATPAAQVAQPAGEVAEIGRLLHEASVALNNDVRLAASVKKAGNVVVPMVFDETMGAPPPGKPDKPLPEYVARNAIGGSSRADGGQFIYGVARHRAHRADRRQRGRASATSTPRPTPPTARSATSRSSSTTTASSSPRSR